MCRQMLKVTAVLAVLAACAPASALGQAPSPQPVSAGQGAPVPADAQGVPAAAPPGGVIFTTACGNPLGPPSALPPAGSPPFVWQLELCFDKQGGSSTVESETYLFYIKFKSSV